MDSDSRKIDINQFRESWQVPTFLLFSFLFSVFAAYHWQAGNLLSSGVNTVGALLFITLVFFKNKILLIKLSATVYLLSAAFIYIFIAKQDNAVLWLFLTPVLATYGLGSKTGLAVSSLGFLLILMHVLINTEFSPDYGFRILTSYLLMSIVSFLHEQSRERLILRLGRTLKKVLTLEELLSVCAWCGNIRKDDRWLSLESYMQEQDTAVSHGICPKCVNMVEKENDLV